MRDRPRLALSHVFVLTLAGLFGLLSLLFYLLLDGSRRAVLESAERLRESASLRIATHAQDYLYAAQKAIEDVEAQIQAGALRADPPAAVEPGLLGVALGNPNLAEVTLTHARLERSADADVRLAPAGRWQLSVYRRLEGGTSTLMTRSVQPSGGSFACVIRAPLLAARVAGCGGAQDDPTEHPTFETPIRADLYGQAVWTDLHFSELDAQLPEPQRRVIVNVMKAVEDARGVFVGVLRAGLLVEQLDAIARLKVNEAMPDDPHRVFLCDERGALITRLSPGDALGDVDGNVRVVPVAPPPDVTAALRHPALGRVSAEHLWASGDFSLDGRRYLVTFRGLGRTQGWRVGIVVPEDYYLGDLLRARDTLLWCAAAVMGLILAGGALTLRAVRRGLSEIVQATARMRRFDFAPAPAAAPFREVADVMDGLERAKTAMRAMGKYVPIDLVRRLYETKREPVLGGELLEVSLLFSDIKDFTSISEQLEPDELARTLGRYLEVMTAAVHSTHGVIDKYIGDAVMAVWNAPSPVPDHARQACRAALACQQAIAELFDSPEWRGKPALVTRIGLHLDKVMVGHFGAPDRMSYTALGDGVNLASRLEGLNKAYATRILASEAIRAAAQQEFAFRVVDVVAVKGKSKGVRVYELRGLLKEPGALSDATRAYERAFEDYLARRFREAIAQLEPHAAADPPGAKLLERCRGCLASPPPPDWDGTYVSTSK